MHNRASSLLLVAAVVDNRNGQWRKTCIQAGAAAIVDGDVENKVAIIGVNAQLRVPMMSMRDETWR